jgi:hypothetical protein
MDVILTSPQTPLRLGEELQTLIVTLLLPCLLGEVHRTHVYLVKSGAGDAPPPVNGLLTFNF